MAMSSPRVFIYRIDKFLYGASAVADYKSGLPNRRRNKLVIDKKHPEVGTLDELFNNYLLRIFLRPLKCRHRTRPVGNVDCGALSMVRIKWLQHYRETNISNYILQIFHIAYHLSKRNGNVCRCQ